MEDNIGEEDMDFQAPKKRFRTPGGQVRQRWSLGVPSLSSVHAIQFCWIQFPSDAWNVVDY